jgi:hypothetical protein
MILPTLSCISGSRKDRMVKRQFIDFIWLWRHGDVRRYWEGLSYRGLQQLAGPGANLQAHSACAAGVL